MEEATPEEEGFDAIETRPNPWITALAAAPFAAILPLLVAAAVVHPVLAAFTFHLTILGGFATYYVRRRNPLPRRVPVKVRVELEDLLIEDADGERLERVPRAAITRGVTVPTKGAERVHIAQKRKRDRELSMKEPGDATALLSSLGLGVDQTVASFRGMSRIYGGGGLRLFGSILGMLATTMALTAGAGLLAPSMAPLVMLLGILALVLVSLWPTKIEVGGDGVLTRWLGRERFFSHADVTGVRVEVHGFGRSRRRVVVLELRSGETVNLPTGAKTWDAGDAEMLGARIEAARRAHAEGAVPPQVLLSRGARPFRQWIEQLRAREVTDLRSAAVPKDQLWRVIEDRAADPIDRGAAVVALGPRLSPAERRRLRGAARVTAAPKLRVVLEAAPDAEEEELVEMLEELERTA